MDNWTSLLPGRNPTGMSYAGDYSLATPATGSSSGQNPLLPPVSLPTGGTATNPYDPTGVVPTSGTGVVPISGTGSVPVFPANSGGYGVTNLAGGGPSNTNTLAGAQTGAMGSLFQGMTQKGLNDMYHELNKTYGEGTASLIMSFLMSGAGFNQSAINNLFASLQPGIERGTESLMEQFSTSGNRFGSGAQIGLADYLSQVNLNEGQLETQMYENSVSNFINTLMNVGGKNSQRIANSPSTLDTIMQGLKLGGAAAGEASAQGVGGPLGNILDIIASMGAAA